MDPSLLTAWIASIPGVGYARYGQLRSMVPDLTLLLSASSSVLTRAGLPESMVARIVKHRQLHPIGSLERACTAHHLSLLIHPEFLPSAQGYPPLLTQIPDAPLVLYAQGEIPNWDMPGIAVVGTRKMTLYGEDVTKKFTSELVQAGVMIISGFMYGVDAVAHNAALDGHGKTVGVLGFGFDHMYPEHHRELAARMLASGNCLLSAYPPWQPPSKQTFPARNRIVSGMSLGVLVTEAASKSGTKITANCAVEQGREVFAVPGPVTSIYSEGTKELVNMGATLVTSVGDILGVFSL